MRYGKKWILCITAILFLADVHLAAETNSGLFNAMVSFDRLYIPALVLTGQGKDSMSSAVTAMARLNGEWRRFQSDTARWQGLFRPSGEDMAFIGRAVRDAGDALTDRKDPAAAHEILEGIRKRFLGFRERTGMDYYLDSLTVYHDAMEELYERTSSYGTNARVPWKTELETASAKLAVAVSKQDTAAAFGFDSARMKKLSDGLENGKKTLSNLKHAFENRDPSKVRSGGMKLKKQFKEIYLLFGDFSAFSAAKEDDTIK